MDQVPSLSASPGCDNVAVQPCTVCYKGLVPFGLAVGHKSPRVLSAALSVALFLERQVSSLGTLPMWVLGSMWGGHRSVGGGSDKL